MCKYYVVISDTLAGSFLDVPFFLLAVILSDLHVNPRRKDWVAEKIHRRICVKGITFLTACPPFYVIFCCFLDLLPFPSLVTYLLHVSYGWYSVWWSWLNSQKCESLLQFNTSWLASLRTWYYFRLCFIFSCSGYDFTLIKRSHTSNYCSFLQKF